MAKTKSSHPKVDRLMAYLKSDGRWTKVGKPWPKEIDQWTHFLYDATGNAVSNDRMVGPPRHMQWVAGPTWEGLNTSVRSTSTVTPSTATACSSRTSRSQAITVMIRGSPRAVTGR